MTALAVVLGWLTLALTACVAFLIAVIWQYARKTRTQIAVIDGFADAVLERDQTIEDLRDENARHLEQRVYGTPT